MSKGFTLIQVSLLITLASLVLVACLPNFGNNTANAGLTTVRMNTVLMALRQFEATNARLPCPADATQLSDSTLYGFEAANNGSTGNCTGASPSANVTDSANHVAMGMLPVRTLGLRDESALDGWGRKFTYTVDTSATACFNGTLPGAMTVTDNGSPVNAVAVLLSSGGDGHGAWVSHVGSTGSASRFNSGATDANELTNAHVDNNFIVSLPLTQFIRKPPTSSFGNLIAYRSPLWNLNSTPAAAAASFATVSAPANGVYIAGQTLTFTVTFPKVVTVTGSPSLALTVGSNTDYASYVNGSGTTTLTFGYTLQPVDYAPTGISISSPINTSAGAISYSCGVFIPPSLKAIQVKKLYLYVTDSVNDRVEAFNASGSYQLKFGSIGLLAGQFVTPRQPIADASGNIWVSDWGNSRVEQFSASGSYVRSFGSLGILNGQFVNAGSMATDSTGNIWVADEGNSRVQQFSGTGSYINTLGSAGILNGQFAIPTGIAFDGAGNIWVGDWGNNRLQKFSATGAYLAKFGSLGSGNGQFVNPCGQAIDSAGNIWVADNGNNRVQKFDASGNYLTQFGGFGSGNGQFAGPCGIAIDVAGNIWVGDSGNNRVQEFVGNGVYNGKFGTSGTGNGQFIVPGGIGLLYQ